MPTRNGEETEKEHETAEVTEMYEPTTETNAENQDNGDTQNSTKFETKNGHKVQINTETPQNGPEFNILLDDSEVFKVQPNGSNTQNEQPVSIIQAVPSQEPAYIKMRFVQDSNYQKSHIPPAGAHRPRTHNPPGSHTFINDAPRPNNIGFPHGQYAYNHYQGRPNIQPIAIPREIYLQQQQQGDRPYYAQKLVIPIQSRFGQDQMPSYDLIQSLPTDPMYNDYHVGRTWLYD